MSHKYKIDVSNEQVIYDKLDPGRNIRFLVIPMFSRVSRGSIRIKCVGYKTIRVLRYHAFEKLDSLAIFFIGEYQMPK